MWVENFFLGKKMYFPQCIIFRVLKQDMCLNLFKIELGGREGPCCYCPSPPLLIRACPISFGQLSFPHSVWFNGAVSHSTSCPANRSTFSSWPQLLFQHDTYNPSWPNPSDCGTLYMDTGRHALSPQMPLT